VISPQHWDTDPAFRPLPHPQMSTGLGGMSAPADEAQTELPAPPDKTSVPASGDPAIAQGSLEPPPPLGLGDNDEGPSGVEGAGAEALGGRVEAIRALLEAHQFVQAEAACEASLADHPGHPEFLGLRSALVASDEGRGAYVWAHQGADEPVTVTHPLRAWRGRAVSRLCQGRAHEALHDATRAVYAWPHWGKV
jgi:hypothetical protein